MIFNLELLNCVNKAKYIFMLKYNELSKVKLFVIRPI